MGLLSQGKPLTWAEIEEYIAHVKEHGVTQFINLYNKIKVRQNDNLFWGDEIECTVVRFDHENKTVANIKTSSILEKLMEEPG